MPNRVKNGFRPSVSNWELSFSHATLPARTARQARSTWSGCGLGAFQNTITESPMNLSTVPPSARNASVSAPKWRDVWRIKLSGVGRFGNARKIRDVGKQDGDLWPHSAKLGGDGAINDSFDDVFRDKASEGPDAAPGDRYRPAEFVNL